MGIFGKIMGKLLEKQAKTVVENLAKDPLLKKLSEDTDKSAQKLKEALKKAEKSNKEKMKKLGIE
tara:strand:+ start:257 stop:451 length:195 start_codon:yes stop_codon:yes gene_type:complete